MSQGKLLKKIRGLKNFEKIKPEMFSKEDILEGMKMRPEIITERAESLVEKHVLRKLGLTTMNTRILFVIDTLGETTQNTIQEYVYTSRANISQRITTLIKQGLVKKVTKPKKQKDARLKFFALTKKGKHISQRALEDAAEFKRQWSKHFDPKEVEIVLNFYSKLSRLLDEVDNVSKND